MEKSKKVVVMYFDDDWHLDVPFQSADTRAGFEDWHRRGAAKNIEMFRSSIQWFDFEKNVFLKSWAFRDEKWIKITEPVAPDLVYDKVEGGLDYRLMEDKCRMMRAVKIYNNPFFRLMFNGKLSQLVAFKDFLPVSYVATSEQEKISALKKIPSQKAVIKPIYGSGGYGILIDDKEKLLDSKISESVIVQEFIVSENGVPGISRQKEVADLRMVFMNHEMVYAYSRKAKEGSLFTNFHQGGTAELVDGKDIPANAWEMAEKIQRTLRIFPTANYSLDFMFTNDGQPVFIEMNTVPGHDLINIIADEALKEKYFDSFMSNL